MMKSFFLFALLIMGWHLFADELTYKGFIKKVMTYDPVIKSYALDEKSSSYEIDRQLPTRQLLFALEEERGYSISGPSFNTGFTTGRLSKDITKTGTSLSLSHSEVTRPDREESVTSIRLNQSLLNNAFGRDTRLQEKSLRTQFSARKLELDNLKESYLAQRSIQYLDYQRTFLEYELSREIVKEVNTLYDVVKRRYKRKIATLADLNRGKLLKIQREEILILRKNDFIDNQGQTFTNIGETAVINPSKQLKIYEKVMDSDFEQLRIPFEQSRRYQQLKNTIDSSQDELTLAQRVNNLDLDFFGGYSRDDSNRFNASVNREEVFMGLRLEIHIGDNQAKAAEQIAGVNLDNANLDLQRFRESYNTRQETLSVQIKDLKKFVKLRSQKVETIKQIIKDETKRYQVGRYDLEDLIDLETEYALFRNQYVLSKITLSKKVVEWLDLNDKLLEFIENEVM